MRTITLLIILIYGFADTVYSQKLKIVGTVSEQLQNIRIPYVNIYIKHNPEFGTVANQNGEFELSLSSSDSDTLVFSAIGYRSFFLPINQIIDGRAVDIKLILQPTVLDEVIIYGKKNDGYELVKKAANSIPLNYPARTHYLDAFYRQTDLKDSSLIQLIEGALYIQDFSYRNKTKKVRFSVLNLRRSDDQGEISKPLQLMTHSIAKMVGQRENELYSTYEIIGRINKEYLLGWEDYTILDESLIDNDTIVRIRFEAPSHYRQNNYSKWGILEINTADFAIVNFEYYEILNRKIDYQITLKFNKGSDDRYYPKFLELNEYRFTTFSYSQRSIKTFLFNNITTKENKIRKNKMIPPNQLLGDLKFDYDPNFWKTYITFVISPVSEKIKKDIERVISLEEQYQKNGKRHSKE